MKKILRIIFVLFILLYIPEILEACPMCQGPGSEKTVSAYKQVTLFLAALPILGGAGIFYWIYLQNKKINYPK